MKESPTLERDMASKRDEIARTGIRNWIKIIVTGALFLTATFAMAGVIFVPVGGRYLAPELATVNVQKAGDEKIRIQTNGLIGEWTMRGGDFPPEYDIATTAKLVMPFDQELDLIIDLAEGSVSGHASMDWASPELAAVADVRGRASCLPFNGRECGQLVVDLELRGVVTDPVNPSNVGQLGMEVLGSMFFDGSDVGFWAAMSANTRIGANEGLINSISQYAACREALVIC